MQTYRCANCMGETPAYPCPHCGYNGRNETAPDYALKPGTILDGKYLMGRVLGQGGFGITYVGFDLSLERKVAIKEFFPAGAAMRLGSTSSVLSWNTGEQSHTLRQAGIQSVLGEARKMAKLEAIPQVVGVREAFEANNTAYIVMDFVDGESLKARLQRTGPLFWQEAQKLFLPVIQALEKVHQAGLIHRDISPDNLMVLPDGTMKLLDLGAAKDISGGSGGPSAEVVKNGFSPFEQYTQRGSAGPWSDVYALAATILYSLTGKLPPSALDRVAGEQIDWNRPELQSLPQSVREALGRAMELQMQDRTPSMAAFADDLARKLPLGKSPKKPIAIACAAGAAVLTLALVLGLSFLKKAPSSPAPPSAPVAQESTRVRARIEEQVLYDDNGVTITATSLKYTNPGAEVWLHVKNDTNTKLQISTTNDASVNGYACMLSAYLDVEPNAEVDGSLSFYGSEVEKYQIDVITDMTFRFEFRDSSYEQLVLTDPITIYTDQYGEYTQVYDDSGEPLLNANGISIAYRGELTTNDKTGFRLYYNSTSQDIMQVSLETLVVNDFMVQTYASATISPGVRGYLDILVPNAIWEELSISSLGKIQLQLKFSDTEFNTLGISDLLTLDTGKPADAMILNTQTSTVLYNLNGLLVANLGYLPPTQDNSLHCVALYVENNTGKTISILPEQVAVDGTKVYCSVMNGEILPGKKAIVKVGPSIYTLENNNISSISNLCFDIRIWDDNWDEIVRIPSFTVSVP